MSPIGPIGPDTRFTLSVLTPDCLPPPKGWAIHQSPLSRVLNQRNPADGGLPRSTPIRRPFLGVRLGVREQFDNRDLP